MKRIVVLLLPVLWVVAVLAFGASQAQSGGAYVPRGLRMDPAADPEAYLALCAAVGRHRLCASVRPCIEILEEEFLEEGVRWQVVNTVALGHEPDIRDGFRKVPKELAKLKKEFDKGGRTSASTCSRT